MNDIYYLPRNDNDLENMIECHYWIAAAYELGLNIRAHKHINEYESAIFIGTCANHNKRFKNAIYPCAKSNYISQFDLPRSNAYRKWLNRNYAIVDYKEGYVGVIQAAAKFKRRVFIKNQAQSKQSFLFHCDAGDVSAIMENIGYFLEHQSNDVLIYDYVEMTHETRFVVINQKVVSGSRIDAKLTPLQNPKMDKYFECEIALIKASQQIVDDFANELPELTEYVLDLCLIDNKPSIVEVNPTWCYGLYGNHPINILPEIVKV